MKVLILGSEGYIGTALYTHLEQVGHIPLGVDNHLRDKNTRLVGAGSITPKNINPFAHIDISKDYESLAQLISLTKPDTIVHLAEQPSAPFSMMNEKTALATIENNTKGTMNVLWAIKNIDPNIHLIKLGTEGEYPDWLWNGKHIPEGHYMEVNDGWKIPVPRNFGSFYHSTKFYESHLIEYACRIWGLRATDVNQGVVYGHRNNTRLDVDEYFGTVINRFVAQAVAGIPLTVYGKGGQVRGFINLQNSLEAITLLTENPPKAGEFRVIHQTTQEYSVMEIAEKIQALTGCEIKSIPNPRVEMDENKFTFDTSTLDNLGLVPVTLDEELPRLIEVVKEFKENIPLDAIMPKTNWK